jgi:ribosomal protein L24
MPLDTDEFKFPDEIEDKKSNEIEIEIEIEDDAPVEDRGRQPLPKPLVEELERDELDQYDDNVKTKLKQMRKVWHDERREKEAALREQQEAIRLIQHLDGENKRIKQILSTGEKEYVATVQNAAEMQVKAAQRSYKDAIESGDTDGMIEAQQAMQIANMRLIQANNFKMPPLQEGKFEVQPRQEQQVQVPRPDNRALAWQERNSWYGQDPEMTASALGLHEKLKRDGVVVGSDEYYATLDRTIRRRFPEVFGEEEQNSTRRTKSSTVVAPAVRSTASNKVKLKQSQVNIARKLGLTPEQYVKEMRKLEAQNG